MIAHLIDTKGFRVNSYSRITKGADVNAKNNRNETPLDFAVKVGYTKIVEYLKTLA